MFNRWIDLKIKEPLILFGPMRVGIKLKDSVSDTLAGRIYSNSSLFSFLGELGNKESHIHK